MQERRDTSDSDPEEGATATVDQLKQAAEDGRDSGSRVTIGKLLDAFGHRSYGPFLLVPALVELSPIGGIPGVPTLLALIVVLFAAQMLAGRDHFWLPQFIQDRRIKVKRVEGAADKMHPVTERLDRWFGGRLRALTGKTALRAAAVCCILLALTVPPLELIPFASSIPMAAIAAFGLALIVHDGLLMLIAFLLTTASIGAGTWLGLTQAAG
jgi:hypothetical protein